MSGSLIPSGSTSGPHEIPPRPPVTRGHPEHLTLAENIIQRFGAELANAVKKTLQALPLRPDDPEGALTRIQNAAKIIQAAHGAPSEVRERAISEITQYAALIEQQMPHVAAALDKELDALSAQLAFHADAILEELSDQTVGLEAGHGEV